MLSRCNICLSRTPLSEDHIFPRCITPPGPKIVKELFKTINPNQPWRRNTKIAQNGLKFKTLCQKCNNDILGGHHDKELESFYLKANKEITLHKYVNSKFLHIKDVKLNKISRAIAGHLLAADNKANPYNKKTRALRRYVLKEENEFPEDFEFCMWLYPFSEQMILKDIWLLEEFGKGNMLWMTAYKAFPFAFGIKQAKTNYKYPVEGILELTNHLTTNIEQSYNLRLSTKKIPPAFWPEAPTKHGAMLTSDSMKVSTYPHKKITPYPY